MRAVFLSLIALFFVALFVFPTPAQAKSSYSIALFGDSFIDTMENMEPLRAALKKRFPTTSFTLYNYGIGSQNAQMGLDRWNSDYNYKTRHYPSIVNLHPDIIILGSFAYNPFAPYNRDQHWQTLQKLQQQAKNTGADVYQLAEIAPLADNFGKGPNGVNWPASRARDHAGHITEQLENAIFLAKDHSKIPLINAYFPSRVSGRFGDGTYTEPNDGIHPSLTGHKFMADLIAAKIRLR